MTARAPFSVWTSASCIGSLLLWCAAGSLLPACHDATPTATLLVGDPNSTEVDGQLGPGDDALDHATADADSQSWLGDAASDDAASDDANPDTAPADANDGALLDADPADTAFETGADTADSPDAGPDAPYPSPDAPYPSPDAPYPSPDATECASQVDCNDNNPCTSDTCLVSGACQWLAAPGPCSDGNACTVGESCVGAKCGGGTQLDDLTACGDGNVCTQESCDPELGCVVVTVAGSCSDGNPCTAGDSCSGSSCKAGASVLCDDANPCTADSCDQASGGCFSQVQAAACNDGNPCTVGDVCQGVACTSGPLKGCDDGNACTSDACNPQSGNCSNSPASGPCDDGNACTNGDSCGGGTCKGGPVKACDDGNPCTKDACAGGVCTTAGMPDGAACGAQMVCKAGACSTPASTSPSSCDALKGGPSSVQTIDIDGYGPLAPAQTYCEMGLAGGGWTLLAVVSDDNNSTFTWNSKDLWGTAQSQVGTVAALNKDFRSPLLANLPAKEVLFQHSSGVWAQYTFGDGKSSLGATVAKTGGPICYGQGKGLAMTAGSLLKTGKLCETMLYLNPADHDGVPSCNTDNTPEHAWGPAWNVNRDVGCFDDPGWAGSLGPVTSEPSTEGGTAQGHPVGFGWAIGVNGGSPGSASNWMRVFAR